jgi:hypothetical protein
VIEWVRKLRLRRGHPRPIAFSQFLEGDLPPRDRVELETHVRDCLECRRLLRSLSDTIEALGSLGESESSPSGLADSVIAALRASSPSEEVATRRSSGLGAPQLAIVRNAVAPTGTPAVAPRQPRRLRALLRYCLRRPQLRLTVPIAVGVGTVLSFVNQGGMLMAGRIDLGMCAVCGLNFVVPFVALNIVLVTVGRVRLRRRV